ncbi:MAG: hypothetical protein DU480_14500 [Nitrosomonas sp.]|uniref:virulence factor TspB C-terminal domain-related protein n=1 Tax=Nitrosomonas sp. TaxID=42353 RepID=UPI0032ED8B30
MAHLYRLIAFLCFFYPSISFSQSVVWTGTGPAPVGFIDLAGWIKNADGTSTRAFSDGNGTTARVTLTSAPKGITTTSTALVQTSKGITAMDIVKTANVNTARLGSAMVGLAKKAGPLGMTLTAATLVCELTNICNQSGQWIMGADPALAGFPTTTPNYKWAGYNGAYFPDPYTACNSPAYLNYRNSVSASPSPVTDTNYSCGFVTSTGVHVDGWTGRAPGCADNYVLTGSTCTLQGNANPKPATNADLDAAAPKLNDDRVTPHLIEAGEPLPTDSVPTLTPDQKKRLGLDSVPTKDSNGNTTGREDTTTEIEAVDSGSEEKPGGVIIKETKTTIKYDNNNTQISSTTNTSYTNQPEPQQPQGFTISFDTVPEATLPTYNVPNTFGSTSWGSGTCPPNIDVTLTNFSFAIPSQPVCDTAEMINPFVLLISSLIAVYIVAGVRGGNAT